MSGDPLRNQAGVENSLEIVRRPEGVPTNELEPGFLPWTINESQARIHRRLGVAVLIVAKTGVDVQIGQDRRIALQIDSIVVSVARRVDEIA